QRRTARRFGPPAVQCPLFTPIRGRTSSRVTSRHLNHSYASTYPALLPRPFVTQDVGFRPAADFNDHLICSFERSCLTHISDPIFNRTHRMKQPLRSIPAYESG